MNDTITGYCAAAGGQLIHNTAHSTRVGAARLVLEGGINYERANVIEAAEGEGYQIVPVTITWNGEKA